MASTNQILAQIQHAENSGMVDYHMRHLYSLKEYNGQEYFVNVLLTYLNDATARFAKMEAATKDHVVDFVDVAEDTIKLFGSSANIGAIRLKTACYNLRLAADNCSKDRCLQAFNVAKSEYAAVKPHLDAILQLERDFILDGNRLQG